MAGKISGAGLASVAAGTLFLYAGIKGKSVSKSLQAVISGKSPASTQTANPITSPASGGSVTTPNNAGAAPPAGTPAADLTGSARANRALGKLMAARYGWATGINWQALDYGWGSLESGWSTTAANDPSDPYNHAYGIPQANPGTKMASEGSNWKTSAATQIAWGLKYIKDNYGSPSQVPGWLGQGGYVGY